MIYTPLDISKIINLKIKKPFTYGNNILFDIYTESNELLYLQTPSMIIPFIYTTNLEKKTFSLTLCEYKTKKYTKAINELYNNIIEQLKKKYSKLLIDKEFIEPFYNKVFYPKMFIFKNNKINDIEIYNIFKDKISLQDIVSNDMVTCIFCIKNIWINERSYGINLNLLQIRRDTIIKKGYLFIDSEVQSNLIHNNFIKNNNLIQNTIENTNENLIKNNTIIKKPNIMPSFNLLELLEKRKSILGM